MCFKVSSVQRQLNLLEWSDFVHVPLAIRISFLACFIFLCTGFLLVTFWISSDCLFFIYFFFCSSPGLKCDLSTSGLSQFVLSFWCYTYLVGGRLKIPLCFRNFNFMAFFFLLKEKKRGGGDFGCKFFSMQIFADESYIGTFVRSLRLVTWSEMSEDKTTLTKFCEKLMHAVIQTMCSWSAFKCYVVWFVQILFWEKSHV